MACFARSTAAFSSSCEWMRRPRKGTKTVTLPRCPGNSSPSSHRTGPPSIRPSVRAPHKWWFVSTYDLFVFPQTTSSFVIIINETIPTRVGPPVVVSFMVPYPIPVALLGGGCIFLCYWHENTVFAVFLFAATAESAALPKYSSRQFESLPPTTTTTRRSSASEGIVAELLSHVTPWTVERNSVQWYNNNCYCYVKCTLVYITFRAIPFLDIALLITPLGWRSMLGRRRWSFSFHFCCPTTAQVIKQQQQLGLI